MLPLVIGLLVLGLRGSGGGARSGSELSHLEIESHMVSGLVRDVGRERCEFNESMNQLSERETVHWNQRFSVGGRKRM